LKIMSDFLPALSDGAFLATEGKKFSDKRLYTPLTKHVTVVQMPKSSRRIKLSKNLKPFVSRVVRDGKVQKAFAEQIGKPVGKCVASKVKKGMSGAEIHEIAKECAKSVKGTKLKL